MEPKNPDGYYGLGLAYYNLKNKAMANENYVVLKALDPAQAAKLLDWINKLP